MLCLIVQGSSDWAPLTPQVLQLSLMFFALSLNSHYRAEEHPEFESVEASKLRQQMETEDIPLELELETSN